MSSDHVLVRAFAPALALSLVAVACNSRLQATANDGGLGGNDAALDGSLGEPVDAAVEAPPPACAPLDVARHDPSRPPARHRNLCPTDTLTHALVRCVVGDPSVSSEACSAARASADWAPCYACIFGSTVSADAGADAGPTYAVPIVVTDGLAQLNIGACLDLTTKIPVEGGCASAFYQERECQRDSCEHCAPEGVSRYEECVALADQKSCQGILADSCGLEASAANCDVGSNFIATADVYALRFCTAGF